MKNLHQILSKYDPTITDNNSFKAKIRALPTVMINKKNIDGFTPIMYYVLTKTTLSYFVLETLICDFYADINISDNFGRLPLHIVISSNTRDIEIIKLLVRHTTVQNILTVPRDQFKMNILQLAIVYFMNNDNMPELLSIITDKLPSSSLLPTFNLYRQHLFSILGFMSDVKSIKHTLAKLHNARFQFENPEQDMGESSLLYHTTSSNNKVLTKKLLQYSFDIIDPQVLENFQEYDPEMQNILQEELQFFQREIIIYNRLIHIPDAIIPLEQMHSIIDQLNDPDIQSNTFYTSTTRYSILALIDLAKKNFVQLYLQNPDVNILLDVKDNLNNNIFHIMALIKQYTSAQMDIVYNALETIQNTNLLTSTNIIGQSPLTVAVLCGNIEFIQFYVDHRADELRPQDSLGNNVVHTLAKTPLSILDIKKILKLLGFKNHEIVNSVNKLFSSPIHYAVSSGNLNFIKFWKEVGGSIGPLDQFGNGVLYYLAEYSISPGHSNTDTLIPNSADTITIYNELYDIVAQQINLSNQFGVTPFQQACINYNLLLIRSFIRDFGSDIFFENADFKDHNNFAHNLILGYINEVFYDQRIANIIMEFIPYRDKIKDNYNRINKHNETPLKIFENRIYSLPIYLSIEIEESKHNTFSEYTHNLIKALSFCIVYSRLNGFNDKVIHVLISSTPPIHNKIVYHLLRLLPQELVQDVYNSANDLGQYPIHLIIVNGSEDLLKSILTSNPDLINQLTSNILVSEKIIRQELVGKYQPIVDLNNLYKDLSPTDYAILYKKWDMLNVLLLHAKNTNQKLVTRFINQVKLIVAENDFYQYFVAKDLLQLNEDQIQLYLKLVQYRALEVQAMFKDYPLGMDMFKTLMKQTVIASKVFRSISKRNYPILYNNIPQLKQELEIYHTNNLMYSDDRSNQFFSVLIAHSGHATALVVFRDNTLQYHAYYQDSAGNKIISQVLTLMFNILRIKESNIHSLNIHQQHSHEGNCGLWSMLNIKLIQYVLSNKLVRFAYWGNKNLVTYTPKMDAEIKDLMVSDKALELLRMLESTYTKCTVSNIKRSIAECNWTEVREKIYNMFIEHHDVLAKTQGTDTILIRDVLEVHIGKLEDLYTQEIKLEIKRTESRCTPSLCDDNKSSNHEPIKMQHHPLEEHLTPDVKIQVQLYRNIAFLLSLKDLILDDQSTKLENFMNYIRHMGDILYEGIDNQSDREKQILKDDYNNAQDFLSVFSKDKLLMLVQEPTQDVPLLLDNGEHSLIVYYEHGRYRLYSQNYHYQYIFEVAKESITFNEIKGFANVFFTWCNGYSAEYNIYTLTSEASALDVEMQLAKMNIWNPKAIVPDALELHERTMEGILFTIIRKLFFVNNKVPELIMLKDDRFFINNHERISVRLDKLHKALMYDVDQAQKIINLIRHYSLKIDETYLNNIPPSNREMSKIYCNKVVSKLNSPGRLTVQDLSEISWQVLKESMEKYIDLTPQLRSSVIKMYQVWYQKVPKHIQTFGTITQPLFFLPDMIRAYNNHEYEPLVKIGGIIIMDITTNKLQDGLINKLSSVISADRFKLISKYAKINNLVMKALTIYSIYELYEQTKMLQPESEEYKIITHHLMETEGMLALIILEPFIPEAAPFLWLGLTIEQLWYSGKEINIRYHLNLSFAQSISMALGFEKDELSHLKEESYLFEKNLEGLSTTGKTWQGLNIIRVPQVNTIQWKTIESNKIPSNIKDALKEKHDNDKCIHKVNTNRNQCISEVDGFRVIAHYNATKQGNVLGMLYVKSAYEIAYYDVYRSNSLIVLELNHLYNSVTDIMYSVIVCLLADDELKQLLCPFRPYNAMWLEEREYANITWRRIDNPLNHIRNQNINIYYNKEIIPIVSVPPSLAYTQFDAREGNMYVQCTSQWLDLALQKYSKYNIIGAIFTVYISYKDYPSYLIFKENITTSSTTHPIFNLQDQSGKLQSRYIIADNNEHYQITDNTKIISIICAKPNTYIINSVDEYMQIGNANVSIADKNNIYLQCNTCLIGTLQNLATSHVIMRNVLGLSHSSYILLGKDNISFDITLRGNINIYDADSNLTVVGVAPQTYYSQVLCSYQHQKKTSYSSYNIEIPKMIEILSNVQISRSIQGREITYTNSMMQFSWHTTTNASFTVKGFKKEDLLESLESRDALLIYDTQTAYTKQFIHYVENIKLSEYLVLKKIYYNSTNNEHKILDEFQNVIVGIDQMPTLFICNITKNFMHDMVLLFEDDTDNQYYHIFPSGVVDITINSITYNVTAERMCAIYQNNIINSNMLLKYRLNDTNLQTIGICVTMLLSSAQLSNDNNNYFATKNLPQDTYIYFIDQKVQLNNIFNKYIVTLVDNIIGDRPSNDDITVLRNTLLNTHIIHSVIVNSNGGSMNDFIEALDAMHNGINMLDLSNNDLSSHMERLLSVLVKISTLKVLILQNCQLDDRHLILLLKKLSDMNLNKLDISYNRYNDNDDIAKLTEYQCSNASEIIAIYISYNRFDRTALSLLSQLDCPYLKILDAEIEDLQESLNRQPIINIHLQDNQNMLSILHKLHQCQNISYDILLADYKLQDIEILSLIGLLKMKQFCNIRVLDLSNNAVVFDQIHKLIQVLPTIHGLEILRLRSCHIDNIMVRNLLNILPEMNLRELDLSNNKIDSQGVADMSHGICFPLHQSIVINISGNKAMKYALNLLHSVRKANCDYIKVIDGKCVHDLHDDMTYIRTVRHAQSNDIAKLYLSSTVDNTSTYGHNIHDTTIMPHHKHRHHHGENHELGTKYHIGQKHIAYHNRESRDIEDEFERTEDIDTVLDSQDDIYDSNVRLLSKVFPDINVRTVARESNQFISNKVSKNINSEDKITTDNSANILEWNNDISSAGSSLKPMGYDMIRKVWGYLNVFQWTKKPKDTSGNISNKLSQNILNDHIDSITDQYTANIPNSLKIGHDNSNNSSIQEVTNTFDTHGNLILAQLLTHKLFGNNKLLNAIHYISPEQEYSINLNKLSQEILPILSENYLTNNTNDYISHNNAPQWYKELFQDDCEVIVSKNDDKANSENIYTNNLPTTILEDRTGLSGLSGLSDSLCKYDFSILPNSVN